MDLDWYRPSFASDDSVRFAGIRLETLKAAVSDAKVVDALVVQLEVPGKASVLRALSLEEKIAAVDRQIEVFRSTKTSIWYEVKPPEILAGSLWRAHKLADRHVLRIFSDVKKEADLLPPVAEWLRTKGGDVYAEVPLGRCRVDALSHREGGFFRSARVVAVELKDDDHQIKRGLDQMVTYRDYAHVVYMACTPAAIADQLNRHAEGRGVHHWDADVMYRRVRDLGFGLLVVEGNKVFEFIEPSESAPAEKKLTELTTSLKKARRV